jgi:hypothetical protein
MVTTAGATEFQMGFSDTGNALAFTGTYADALRVQEVLLGCARAGDDQFGLDARSYLFGLSDAADVAGLQSSGAGAIARYLPGVQLQEFVVELLPAASAPQGGGKNVLIMGVSLGTQANTFPFAVVLSAGSPTQVVGSLVF